MTENQKEREKPWTKVKDSRQRDTRNNYVGGPQEGGGGGGGGGGTRIRIKKHQPAKT